MGRKCNVNKSEADLKSELVDHLKKAFPRAVIIRHEDRYRHGVPDISFTLGHTLWFEAKVAQPQLSGKGIQKVTCLQLEAAANNCFYIIWTLAEGWHQTTSICSPSIVHKGTWRIEPITHSQEIDHKLVTHFIDKQLPW